MQAREIAGHAVHLMVLLIPTWCWFPTNGCDGWVGSFAAIVLLAAVLESRSVKPCHASRPVEIQDPQAMRLAQIVGIGLLLLFWGSQLEHRFAGVAWPAMQVAGGLLLTLGLWLRVTAIRTLGADFVSDIRAPSRRCAEGIYQWLDHPSEVGLIGIVIGAPLLLGAPRCLVLACVFFIPSSLLRIRRENRVLTNSPMVVVRSECETLPKT